MSDWMKDQEPWWKKYQVALKPGQIDPWILRTIEVTPGDAAVDFRSIASGRSVRPGTYTQLIHSSRGVIMSDTTAEIQDHLTFLCKLEERDVRRVLINGLGIGMCLRWALAQDHIEHVDVVEQSAEVIELVGTQYADDKLTIHHSDALEMTWPRNTRWSLVWHDIWDDICEDNRVQMSRLHRMYGNRSDWQASWSKDLIDRERQRRYNSGMLYA